jgi:Flp pilus assembly protein TadB
MSALYPYRHLIMGALGILLAYFVIQLVVERWRGPEKAMAQFSGQATGRNAILIGTWEYKVQILFKRYRLDVSGQEHLAFVVVVVLLGVLVTLGLRTVGLPPVTWPGGLVVAFIVARGLVSGAWDKMTQDIEKEIPTMLIRFSGMVQATPNVLQALDEIGQSLDPDKPLKEWLLRMVDDIQAQGVGGLDAMETEAQAMSPALLLAVIQIRRIWETGGKGHIDALRMVSDHLSELVATRSLAQAKAGRSWGTARIIVFSSVVSLGFILNNPASQQIFLRNPLTQLGLVAMLVWGGFGLAYINNLIRKVTE